MHGVKCVGASSRAGGYAKWRRWQELPVRVPRGPLISRHRARYVDVLQWSKHTLSTRLLRLVTRRHVFAEGVLAPEVHQVAIDLHLFDLVAAHILSQQRERVRSHGASITPRREL